MRKAVFFAIALLIPCLARGQTTQLYYVFSASASGGVADVPLEPQVDAINVRINGVGTTTTWTAQIQTAPDNATWTNCGSAVTAAPGASGSGGACTPSGAAYVRVLITAGTGGGTLYGALMGTCSLCQIASGGAVDSVTNSDGTLTITPTTGAVVASLDLAHSNTWTAPQTINSGATATGLDLIATASSSSLGLTNSVGTWTMSNAIDANGAANIIFYSPFFSRQAFYIGEDDSGDTNFVQVPQEFSYTWSNTGSTVDTTPQAGFSSPSAGVISADTTAQGNSAATLKVGAMDVNGPAAGNPATIFIQKNPNDYGVFVYDNSGSTVPEAEGVNSEIYNITGSLTSLRANYRGHIDPSNTSPTAFQLVNFAAGSHGANAISFASVSDGLDSIGYFNNAAGLYNEFTNIGNPPYTVSNVQSVGGVCSITMTGTAAFLPGSSVIVSGILGATACNGTQTVASVSGSTFTTSTSYSGSPAYTSGGSVLQNVSTQNEVVNDFGTGDTFDINQSAAVKTGDIFHVNVNQGGGSLSGNFISYYVNGTPEFLVTNTGEIETAASVSTPSLTINGDSPFTAAPRAFLPFSTGQLAGIVTGGQYFAGQLAKSGTVESFVATAAAFTCTTNPTLTLEDCGTSAGTCSSPTALASVTLTAANTVTAGTITSATLTGGHYFVVETTAGACTILNATGSAEYRMD